MSECPICDKRCQLDFIAKYDGECSNNCRFTRILNISDEIISMEGVEGQKIHNMVFADLVAHRRSERMDRRYYWNKNSDDCFSYEGSMAYINVATLMKNYPEWMLDRYDMVLLNAYHLHKGFPFNTGFDGDSEERLTMMTDEDKSCFVLSNSILDAMVELGYFTKNNNVLYFTQKSWTRIAELIQKNEGSKSVFIAIGYKNTEDIVLVLKETITEAGYVPVVMVETHHNNQIVPEMFEYIRRCRFLIMDTTFPNLGAYYEAGLASGLGKPTILTCRKDAKDSDDKGMGPHFDVAQQSMVIWKDLNDLKEKLAERIEMTID